MERQRTERPRHRLAWQIPLLAVGLAFWIASPALAQWDFGIRGGIYTEVVVEHRQAGWSPATAIDLK